MGSPRTGDQSFQLSRNFEFNAYDWLSRSAAMRQKNMVDGEDEPYIIRSRLVTLGKSSSWLVQRPRGLS